MMRRLKLDFNQRHGAVSSAAMLVLLVGTSIALSLQTDLGDVRDKVSRLDTQLTHLVHSSKGPSVAKTSLTDGQRGEVILAQATIRQLTTPWGDILGALEAGLGDDVVLIAIDSDVRRDVLSVTAEARNAGAMLTYLDRLAATSLLRSPVLTGHQEQEQITERPIRFTFQVGWRQAQVSMAAYTTRD